MKCPKCYTDNPENHKFCSNCGTPFHFAEQITESPTKTIQISGQDLPEGKLVAEKYIIIKKLGEGGMGVVFKAKDTKLKRVVALKFLPPELLKDPEAKERLILEAQAAAALDHPNICTVHEIDESEGKTFISMAFVAGESLKQKIKKGPLILEDALNISIQIAEGLEEARKNGIVHRDIKSANIMVDRPGRIKIMDFGLAKYSGQTRITKTATIIGTVAYMSPEQAQGKDIDHRTDIWSMGVVFYEMLTSKLPFKGEHEAGIINSIVNRAPVPPTEYREDIPREIESIILKCLRKDPNDRYQSAGQIIKVLNTAKNKIERKKLDLIREKKEEAGERKEAERRQATVMIVEVFGYNDLLEFLEEEEVASYMNRCFSIFQAANQKYGGNIDKVTGCSITALFGVPVSIEDAPKKAVNAAIEFRNKLHQFNLQENLKIPLEIHIGINTGPVIISAMGAIGDTINLASQLKEISPSGKIYVGPLTFKYTHTDFKFRELKPITLKGKKETVSLFELLSEKEKIYRARLGSDRMITSEIVGREKEINKLQLHVMKVINGEGSIVNIIGEAGIGKSRLIAELKEIETLKKVTVLEGRALSIGKNLSFHPIIDILKNWAGIKESDKGLESEQKLENAIRSIDPEGLPEMFPFIATLMGMKFGGGYRERIKGIEGEALEKLILKNLRELFIKIAEQCPLVVIIEDLHWADMTSIEFLESVLRIAENNPVLFINVFRPNYRETGERILGTIDDRYYDFSSNITLESLNESQSEVLINNLLKIKGFPSNIKNLITKRAEGNPFFIEEVARSFIDDGIVEIKDGNFRVTGKIESVVIPETINEVLMARIDKLDEDTRSLLKVASVIGRNFFYRILTGVAESIEEIDDKLELLKEIQLIRERSAMTEIEYLFKHALVQEATYQSILLIQRKQLHLKIAESIESIFSDRLHEFFGMLALHYSKGEDLEKAEEYLIKSGEEALKSSASSEALHYYQEALKIYLTKYGEDADPEKVAMLEKNIALAFFNRGDYVNADEYFARVLAFYNEKLPQNSILVFLKFFKGFFGFILNLYSPFMRRRKIPSQRDNEIINLFYKKDTALIVIDPRRMFIESFYWLNRLFKFDFTKVENGIGILSISSGTFSHSGLSFKLSKRIIDYVRPIIDKADKKSLLTFKVADILHKAFSGDWDSIEEYDEQLVDLCVRNGELFYTSSYVLIHGYSNVEQGYYKTAQQLNQKQYEIADIYENNNARLAYYWFGTQLLMKYRKLNEALNEAEEGMDFANKKGFKPYYVSLGSYKARIQMMMGNIKDAEETLQRLNEIKHEVNLVPYFQSTVLLSQFMLYLYILEQTVLEDNRSAYVKNRKQVYKTGKKTVKNSRNWAADRIESYRFMGVYYWLIKKQQKAVKWFKKSIKEGDRLKAKLELSRTYLEIGKRLQDQKSKYNEINGISVTEYLEMAEGIFKELGLEWDLKVLLEVKNG